MKICPHCQNRYTDDTLKFCLQDGAALIDDESQTSMPTFAAGEEQATVVRNRPNEQINFDLQNSSSFAESAISNVGRHGKLSDRAEKIECRFNRFNNYSCNTFDRRRRHRRVALFRQQKRSRSKRQRKKFIP